MGPPNINESIVHVSKYNSGNQESRFGRAALFSRNHIFVDTYSWLTRRPPCKSYASPRFLFARVWSHHLLVYFLFCFFSCSPASNFRSPVTPRSRARSQQTSRADYQDKKISWLNSNHKMVKTKNMSWKMLFHSAEIDEALWVALLIWGKKKYEFTCVPLKEKN